MNLQFANRIPVVNKFLGENYTTKVGLWRRRGDGFQFEIHDAVRYRYEDRPNAHVLDSGEEIPAVPLSHIYTMSDGTPYFEAVEIEDGQYAPRQNKLNVDGKEAEKELSFEELEMEFDVEVEKITEESRSRLDNLMDFQMPEKTPMQTETELIPLKRDLANASMEDNVIVQKDTRLNFWLDHLKESREKYGVKGWLKDHMNIILIVVTAFAVGIIFYTSPLSSDTLISLIRTGVNELQTLNSNLQTLQQAQGLGNGG